MLNTWVCKTPPLSSEQRGLELKYERESFPSQERKRKGYGGEANKNFQSGDPGSNPGSAAF